MLIASVEEGRGKMGLIMTAVLLIVLLCFLGIATLMFNITISLPFAPAGDLALPDLFCM